MGLMDKLAEGAERAAREAEKAFDKGKTKVGELQVEMQMDGLARKLGYLVFDFYRGRQVDQAYRQRILDDMSRLEDQLLRARAQAAAKPGAANDDAPSSDAAASSPHEADGRSQSDLGATPTDGAPSADDTTRADDDSSTVS